MRTILFLYALLTLLSGCSKDNGSPSASTSGVTSSNCPTLDGTYAGLTQAGETLAYTFTTERDGAVTKYTFAEGRTAGNYPLPADGSKISAETPDGPMTLSLACGGNSLIMSTQTGSQAVVSMTFTDLGGGQLTAEAAGQTVRLSRQ